MAISNREDRSWALGWIVFGTPAMAAGCLQGYRYGDSGFMVATIIVAVLLLVINIPILMGRR